MSSESTPPPTKRSAWRVLFYLLLVGAVLWGGYFSVRSSLWEPFRIPAGSMSPTLLVGDHILVQKSAYGFRLPVFRTPLETIRLPERGDVVVFIYPGSNEGKPLEQLDLPFPPFSTLDYVKRVIGLPGDTIEVKDSVVILNGEPLPQERVGEATFVDDRCRESPVVAYTEKIGERTHGVWRSAIPGYQMKDFGPVTVPADQLFMLGDNRDHSADSRVWGFVPVENVKGRATNIWISLDSCTGTDRDERAGAAI